MASAKALLWFLPALAFLIVTLAVDGYRSDALTVRKRLFIRGCQASLAALGFVKVAIAGRGIMGIQARWERALVRWIMLLAVALMFGPCYVVLDHVAHMLALGVGATDACAVVLVAVHLCFGWVAIFGV